MWLSRCSESWTKSVHCIKEPQVGYLWTVIDAIFSPGLFSAFHPHFASFMMVWGLGFGVTALNWISGVWAFCWWGLGPTWGAFWVFGSWGSSYKHSRITLGINIVQYRHIHNWFKYLWFGVVIHYNCVMRGLYFHSGESRDIWFQWMFSSWWIFSQTAKLLLPKLKQCYSDAMIHAKAHLSLTASFLSISLPDLQLDLNQSVFLCDKYLFTFTHNTQLWCWYSKPRMEDWHWCSMNTRN